MSRRLLPEDLHPLAVDALRVGAYEQAGPYVARMLMSPAWVPRAFRVGLSPEHLEKMALALVPFPEGVTYVG